ncbi:transposase, partial [Lentilactobacillus parabuchneri]
KAQQAFRIETIRKYLLKVAGKVVHTARRIQLKLSATHVYQGLFKRILLNIQQL